MVDAATSFKKSGFSDEDAKQLAVIAQMYTNVADETLSAGESADFIVSQLKAFNLEATKAEHIIDAVNNVSNNMAVSSADLATNIGHASAAMAVGGNTYEETLAIMAGMVEITQNGAKAARGLVSIQSRLNQVTDETSSVGKALSDWYEEHGIAVYDKQTGQIRSLYDILQDVGAIWGKLSKNEQLYYLNQQAGANQTQNLAAALDNITGVQKAYDLALNSTNSAQKENEKATNSLEGRTNLLKAEFQDLANNVIPNELIKSLLDLGTEFLKLANTDVGRFLTRFGLLTTTVLGGSTMFVQLGSKVLPMLTGAFKTAAGGVLTFKNSFGWISIAIGLVVSLSLAFSELNEELNKSPQEKLEETEEKLKNLNDELQTNVDRLKEIEGMSWTDRTKEINDEYFALKQQNAELERKIELEKINAIQQRKEALEAETFGTAPSLYGITPAKGKYVLPEERNLYSQKQFATLQEAANFIQSHGLGDRYEIKELKQTYVGLESVNEVLQEYLDKLNARGKLTAEENANLVTLIASMQSEAANLKTTNELRQQGIDVQHEETDAERAFLEVFEKVQAAYGKATEKESGLTSVNEKLGGSFEKLRIILPELYSKLQSSDKPLKTLQKYCDDASISVDGLKSALMSLSSNVVLSSKMTELEQLEEQAKKLRELMGRAHGYRQELVAEQRYGSQLADLEKRRKKLQEEIQKAINWDAFKTKDTDTPTSAQKNLETFQTKLKTLDHQLAMNQISTENYYASLQKLMNQYLQDAENQETLWKYEEKIYAWRTKKDEELAKKRKEETIASLQKELDVLEQQKSAVEELYDAKNKALENSNKMLERQLKLEELIQDIADARAKKILVFRNGRFEYTSDTEAISAAKKNYNQYLQEIWREDEQSANETARDLAVAAIEAKIARQQERISKAQNGYASGTLYSSAGLHLVGENGPELRVMGAGEGVLPADITKNLWDWGLLSPKDIVSNLQAGASGGLSFNNVTMSFPSVHNANDASSFVEQLVNLAYQRAYKRT